MKSIPLLALVLIGTPVAAVAAGAPCPPRETGSYPWAGDGIVNGDLYAWVNLKIGKDRRPECSIGQNNIHDSDLRFFVCRAFAEQWKRARPEDAMPGTVVKRLTIMAGPSHAKIEKEERRQYFIDHPDQRPECFPEN